MRKTIAAILTAMALVAALVLPMSAFALTTDLADGNYDVDYTISGTGTMKLVEPATLTVKDGTAYARLAWNDPEVDKLYLQDEALLPVDYTKSHNIQGKLPVFELPLAAFGKDISFDVHTRGVNLELDEYTLNMQAYDPDFDASVKAAEVAEDISGAQPVKFYKWHTGMSFSLWGPFVFLALECIAIYAWTKVKKEEE